MKDKLSVSGNAQRNFALDYLNKKKDKNFFIYFLDDDNILHKNFYKVIQNLNINNSKLIYTFDQLRKKKIFINNKFYVWKYNKNGYIDIAMFLPNFSLINKIRWVKKKYTADGDYIVKCMKRNKQKHKYLPMVGSHYNYLSNNLLGKIKQRILKIYKRKSKN